MKYDKSKHPLQIADADPAVLDVVLDEACRQWCDMIDEAPERLDGIGFSNFFKEIFNEKYNEYAENIGNVENSADEEDLADEI